MTLVMLNDPSEPHGLRRVPQGEARRKCALRDLIQENPAIMPAHDLVPAKGDRSRQPRRPSGYGSAGLQANLQTACSRDCKCLERDLAA